MFNSIENFLNSSFTTSLLGAIAGSGTILIIDWIRRQNQKVAEINSFMATLSIMNETLILIKQQQIQPLQQNYDFNQHAYKININSEERLQLSMIEFATPDLNLELKTESLQNFAIKNAETLQTCQRLKRSLHQLEIAYAKWNETARNALQKLKQNAKSFILE